MLYREWTKDYEDLQNQRYEKEKERLQLVKEIDEIDKKLKDEEGKMDKMVNDKYVKMLQEANQKEVLAGVYQNVKDGKIEEVIFRNDNGDLVVYYPQEGDLYEFHTVTKLEGYVYCYHIRTYEDALDGIKELSYGKDTFIRNLWKEAIDDCYENCSLEEFMEHYDLSQVDDFSDLKEDVDEPQDCTLEKLYELEQDGENINYDCEKDYFEREHTEHLILNEE